MGCVRGAGDTLMHESQESSHFRRETERGSLEAALRSEKDNQVSLPGPKAFGDNIFRVVIIIKISITIITTVKIQFPDERDASAVISSGNSHVFPKAGGGWDLGRRG